MIADPNFKATLAPDDVAEDEAAIRGVMASYNDALNGGKTAGVMPLYADDGVFMPPYSQSAVGKAAVKTAYDAGFSELRFHVKFTIAELVVMAPSWAYVRTNSAGTTTIIRPAGRRRKPTRSSSSSGRATTGSGASPATASRPPTRRLAEAGREPSAIEE